MMFEPILLGSPLDSDSGSFRQKLQLVVEASRRQREVLIDELRLTRWVALEVLSQALLCLNLNSLRCGFSIWLTTVFQQRVVLSYQNISDLKSEATSAISSLCRLIALHVCRVSNVRAYHGGWHMHGPAKNRSAKWHGLAKCRCCLRGFTDGLLLWSDITSETLIHAGA